MFVRTLAGGVAAAALMVSAASAADFYFPTTPQAIYAPAGFGWEGLYVGARLGGDIYHGVLSNSVDSQLVLGAHAGVNFIVVDPVLVGLEIQATHKFGGNGNDAAWEVLALGRLGAIVTNDIMVYGAAGFGAVKWDTPDAFGVYALGLGAEYALTDSISLRGELMGLGLADSLFKDDFFSGTRGTLGVSYHF